MSINYALIGAAGYVAPKHMKAIKETGGNLIACVDPHDSVGVLDSYFPECYYFNTWERFDRFCHNNEIDYIVICSPNYLHETQIRWALRMGFDVICEKPLALCEHNLQAIKRTELETGKKVNVILQLRLMEQLIKLKASVESKHKVSLIYITPRGNWYNWSWKGDESKSGGLATNIGVHLFDLLCWLFGSHYNIRLSCKDKNTVAGKLLLDKADVDFILSINGCSPERSMIMDGQEIDFNNNFTNLHTKSYKLILSGLGFGVDDTVPSISICERIRGAEVE